MADNLMTDFKSFNGNGTSAITLDGGFQEFLRWYSLQSGHDESQQVTNRDIWRAKKEVAKVRVTNNYGTCHRFLFVTLVGDCTDLARYARENIFKL